MVIAYYFAQELCEVRERPGGGSLLVLGSSNVDECLRGCEYIQLPRRGGMLTQNRLDQIRLLLCRHQPHRVHQQGRSGESQPPPSSSHGKLTPPPTRNASSPGPPPTLPCPYSRTLSRPSRQPSSSPSRPTMYAPPSPYPSPLTPIPPQKQVQSDEVDMQMTYAQLSRFGTLRKVNKLGPYGVFLVLQKEWGGGEGGRMTPREVAHKVKLFFHFFQVCACPGGVRRGNVLTKGCRSTATSRRSRRRRTMLRVTARTIIGLICGRFCIRLLLRAGRLGRLMRGLGRWRGGRGRGGRGGRGRWRFDEREVPGESVLEYRPYFWTVAAELNMLLPHNHFEPT